MTLIIAAGIAWKIFACSFICMVVFGGLFTLINDALRDVFIADVAAALFIGTLCLSVISFLAAICLTIFAYY